MCARAHASVCVCQCVCVCVCERERERERLLEVRLNNDLEEKKTSNTLFESDIDISFESN